MQNKTLQMKRALRTALLVLLLSVAGMGKGYAQSNYVYTYDFSEVCETGQTLYYKITDEANHQVHVVPPGRKESSSPQWNFNGYNKPTGDVVIPEHVNGYTVIAINTYLHGSGESSQGAFGGCIGLTSITIPSSVVAIASSAFTGCNGLTSVYYTGDITGWCHMYFQGTDSNPLEYAHTLYISGNVVADLTIPDSAIGITPMAFSGCTSLTTVTIPNSVSGIGWNAFKNCSNLHSISIGNSVTSIGQTAFYGCSDLTSVTIPNSVISIGEAAFGSCARLTTVYYNAENADGNNVFKSSPNLTTIHIGADVKEIGSNIFKGCTGVHLIVALGSTPATLVGGAFADFADNSILMVSCGNKLNYFSVWNIFDFNNIMEDCGEYSINLNNIGTGGNVSASTTQAQMGQEVQLTVTPNAGMVLSSLTVCNTSDPTQTFPVYPINKGNIFGFIMPPFGVSVNATFAGGTSIDENIYVPAMVYPNPTNGQVKIEAEDLKHITISNMLGQVIYEGKASGNECIYDFSQHGEGVYLIRIETTSGMATKRVVVTR